MALAVCIPIPFNRRNSMVILHFEVLYRILLKEKALLKKKKKSRFIENPCKKASKEEKWLPEDVGQLGRSVCVLDFMSLEASGISFGKSRKSLCCLSFLSQTWA